jgi:hypothetical protein
VTAAPALAIALGRVSIVQEPEPHFPTTHSERKKNMKHI